MMTPSLSRLLLDQQFPEVQHRLSVLPSQFGLYGRRVSHPLRVVLGSKPRDDTGRPFNVLLVPLTFLDRKVFRRFGPCPL
jgi:hypothetical protein